MSAKRTSKRGCPIIERGEEVDCPHCDEVHEADYRDNPEVGFDIPGGHKRHNHYTCLNTEHGKRFAAEKGSRIR